MIFKFKNKIIIYIKIKKRLNKFNFYIYYIEILKQLVATFEDINNKSISRIFYNILF